MTAMSDMTHRPELLAPAGTIEAGLTAFDAGADAVYAGLSRFNARERGQNFTFDELSKLLGYAHDRGRRVYVTLNTLLKDRELSEVIELLGELAVLRPDAVIVQDLGLLRVLREHFGELEVHASTQMAFHNSAGLELAERLGVSRVILERQVTFAEIEAMRRRSSIDLEVFVHGALCCSRSGVCLFSSWMGGWSGNRGKCKQPCRRRYHSAEGNGFFFSPGDLCALEDLDRLRELGVAGLKIEGRLRRPDYVRKVVTAYRMMLDRPAAEALGEAKAALGGALGRRWHRPFRTGHDFHDAIRHEALGTSGLLCGTVAQVTRGGFEAELSRPLRRWDTVRVQPRSGDEGPTFTVARLKVDGRSRRQARKGQRCFVECEHRVEPGSLIFRTGSATDDLSGRVAELAPARAVVDLSVAVGDGRVRVEAMLAGVLWEAEAPLQPAQKRPLSIAEVAEQFRKTRSSQLDAGRIEVTIDGDLFLHKSALKKLRRSFWSWAEGAIAADEVHRFWVTRAAEAERARRERPFPPPPRRPETVVLVRGGGASPVRGSRTARGVDEALRSRADEVVLPDFCPEGELQALMEKIDRLLAKGRRRFRVTSLYGFALLSDREGVEVTASFPLPVCNSSAVAELLDLGARRATAWVELERPAVEGLYRQVGDALEVMTYGRLPILTTRLHIPAAGRITDGRGQGFRLEREGVLTNLYPDRVLSIEPSPEGVHRFIDLSHARLGERETSDFNWSRELV